MPISPAASGIQTLLQAQTRISASAEKIASATTSGEPQSIVEPLIDLKVAEQQAQAAVRIIETENQTIGSLLDITA